MSSIKPLILLNESVKLIQEFRHLGKPEHLEQAISKQNEALELTPKGNSHRSTVLNALGASFRIRFKHQRGLDDIQKAIEYSFQAIKGSTEESISRLLLNLGISYYWRFDEYGKLRDLELAISFEARAIFCTRDSMLLPSLLNEIGILLHARFLRLKNIQDINHAIIFQKQSIVIGCKEDEELAIWLWNLGRSVRDRFEHLGKNEDLDESIGYLRRAAILTPDSQIALKAARINGLARALTGRFAHQGLLADLDESIENLNQVILLAPDDHPEKKNCLSGLGQSLLKRFERLGNANDINQAIAYHEEVVSLSSALGTSRTEGYTDLGNSFMSRFDYLRNCSDLDEAIRLFGLAVNNVPSNDAYKTRLLGNLGYSLGKRFELQKSLEDIDSSIEFLTQAASSNIENDGNRAGWLANLGSAYMMRFRHLEGGDDLDSTIKCLNDAMTIIPEGHTYIAGILSLLGTSYKCRSIRSNSILDLKLSAFTHYEAARQHSGRPSLRFNAALECARTLDLCNRPDSLELYKMVVDFLPSVVWLGTTVHRRYEDVPGIGSAVTEAAVVAIKNQQYGLALEWLEQGRSIVWQQMLNLRTSFDDLHKVNPKFANRLKVIARRLDHIGSAKPVGSTQIDSWSLEREAQTHRRLAQEWDQILDQVRQIPGFHSFLRPREASELLQAALSGAVVVINVHEFSCDALVLRPNSQDVMHVPLPGFSYAKASTAYNQLNRLLGRKGIRERGFQTENPQRGCEFESILSLLWSDVVQPVLESLNYLRVALTGDLPHITWCTTGPLAFLPLHAAGCYSIPDARVYNYVTSSYTPTLSALLSPIRSTREFQGILAVGQTDTPGFHPLPGTAKGDSNLPDEAVHLAAGMLMAGFPSVIATMWSIRDEDAPLVAEEVYASLLEGGEPDSRRAGRALHAAVERLREKVGEKEFASWVPYIHLGI
ncbi:hypothetical protein BDV93DRAFT_555591 [Ceratobasidium sp. AG-I]|nr:hypothetical protein BDV93DRAFT_555591 [Ceratobasidium sp. AG-I]